MKKKISFFKYSFFYIFTFAASASAVAYVVKQGDTISQIAARQFKGNVYGSGGGVAKIKKLNPEINDLNFIIPGQKIILSDDNIMSFAETPFEKTKDQEDISRSITSDVEQNLLSVDDPSEEFSRFELSTTFHQTRLDAKDRSSSGKSTLGSAFTPEIALKWEQHWKSGLESYLRTHFRREDFQTTSATQKFSLNEKTFFGFEAGAKIANIGDTGKLFGSLGVNQEAFVRASSPTSLVIDSLAVPRLGSSLSFDILRSEVFKLSSVLDVGYLAPTDSGDYKTKAGYSYGVGLRLTHDRKERPFFGGVKFHQQNQDTTISKQSYMAIGLEFGMTFDVVGK